MTTQFITNGDLTGSTADVPSNVRYQSNALMTGLWKGPIVLLTGSPAVQPMAGAPLPAIIKLYVTAGDTLVLDQSFDGGLTYDTPLLTTTTTAGQRLDAGCSHIRVTRTAGSSTTSYFTVCG